MHTNQRLITLLWVHYYPAKPTPHKPRHWNISIEINCVQASASMRVDHFPANMITFSVMRYLITQIWNFMTAIHKQLDEKVQYDPKDFPELHLRSGHCSLAELEVGIHNHRSNTCQFHSRAFQPLWSSQSHAHNHC